MGPFNAYARSRRSRRTDNACFVSFSRVNTHETNIVFDRPIGLGGFYPEMLRGFDDIAAKNEMAMRVVSITQVDPENILVLWDDVNTLVEGISYVGEDLGFNAGPVGYANFVA